MTAGRHGNLGIKADNIKKKDTNCFSSTFKAHRGCVFVCVVFFRAKTCAVLLLLTTTSFAPSSETYFIPVACFLLFNVMDWAGRSLTAVCMWVSNKTNSTFSQEDSVFLTRSEWLSVLFGFRASLRGSQAWSHLTIKFPARFSRAIQAKVDHKSRYSYLYVCCHEQHLLEHVANAPVCSYNGAGRSTNESRTNTIVFKNIFQST